MSYQIDDITNIIGIIFIFIIFFHINDSGGSQHFSINFYSDMTILLTRLSGKVTLSLENQSTNH